MPVTELADRLKDMTPAESEIVDRILRQYAPIWAPLDGPQRQAYNSLADVLGYGGAAGGGKTDLAIGKALTQHTRSAIFRREATQLIGVYDRVEKILGNRDGYSSRTNTWRVPGTNRVLEFGSTPHAGDETKHQGRPKDLLVLDEATNFLQSQVRFLMGWVRTTIRDQRTCVLMTFNPPTDSDGLWIIEYFAPWLSDLHKNPAMPGELRWYITHGGQDHEVDGPDPVDVEGEPLPLIPQSRTFIPSKVTDNPYLVGTNYMSQLQAMPEPLRSQMLYGDFKAGLGDDPWQVIPTSWVEQAMARWKKRDRKGVMDSMGVDVARGGIDHTVIARRHGTWFDEPIRKPGQQSPDGPTVAAYVIAARRNQAVVHIDVVGWGSSPHDFLTGNGVQSVGVNGASGATGVTDDRASLRFANRRAEIWWRMREALDPDRDNGIELPPDPQLKADLCTPKWKLTVRGIQVEAKEEIIKRIGRSPDDGDAYVLANIATPKWEIDPRYAGADSLPDQHPLDGHTANDYDPYSS